MLAIETNHLARSFGETQAVAGLNLAIEPGEIFGFLGANGAGKTTTIKMLTGQIRPTGGEVYVMGQPVPGSHSSLARLIGVVFEIPNLYPRLSVRQNLHFAAQLYDVPRARIDETLERMSLSDRANDLVEKLSSGMKQKLAIARALLHQPRLLFLDEPTTGLDPAFARGIREDILALKEQGTTVFLTTHYMEEADQLCDRVAFIDEGRVVLQDSPSNLKRDFGKPQALVERKDGTVALLSLLDAAERSRLAAWLEADDVRSIHTQEASLEDVFVRVVGKRIQA